jgi:hypothetical protein
MGFIREEKYKGSREGPRWKLGAERVSFCFAGDLKTYDNLLEGEKRDSKMAARGRKQKASLL